jgi:hypothetical protein
VFDKANDAAQQQFKDRWNARLKAVETQSDAQIKAIDDQIDAIQKQEDAEQERDDARQKQFDAEKKRIERLTELTNRSIDYNRALASGNLDEAARVMNNAESIAASFATEDTSDQAKEAADRRSKESQRRIDALNESKDLIKQQTDAQLEALKIQQEAEERSMEASKEIERERLQNKLDSLSKEQQAAEATERKKQEMDRRTLEIELQTLKTFVPLNEAELWQHIGRVQGVYNNHGMALTVKGGYWGQIIGNTLQTNVDRARMQMSNDAAWSAFGASVANAISQGAFGMNLSEFMSLITTGALPQRMTATSLPTPFSNRLGMNPRGAFHAGGEVGASLGSRNGRGNSPLGGDEVDATLLKGEYVVNKSAVESYGTDFLNLVNQQKVSFGTPAVTQSNAVGPGGLMGGMMALGMQSAMQGAMQNMAISAANRFPYARAALGFSGAGSAEALEWARAQAGKPYIWGATGPNGYDCSGFMSAITAFLQGKPLHKRLFSTASFRPGQGVAGFVPGLEAGDFQLGVKHGNPGHMAGTLAGVNVESTGNRVRVGNDASGAADRQFPMQFSLPDFARDPSFQSVLGGISPELAGGVKEIVRQVAAGYGWGTGPQWAALDWLIQHESSWNPTAQNPHSTAFGLYQFLDSTWGGTGIGKTHDPRLQAIAGSRYIQSRYGSPIGAQAFWRGHKWYDDGGYAEPGITMLHNGTGKRETVLNPVQGTAVVKALENYESISRTMNSGSFNKPVDTFSGDTYNYSISIDGTGMSQRELKAAISEAIEEKHIKDGKKKGRFK